MTPRNDIAHETLAPALGRIRDLLDQAQRVLVVSHVDPDGDSLGTSLAFAQHLTDGGKQVFLCREDEIPDKYQFLDGAMQIPHVDDLPSDLEVDTAVILECPTQARVGHAFRFVTLEVKVINIDHHPDNQLKAAAHWLDHTRSSVGEMVFEYFMACGYTPSPPVAEQLYTAIMTDTGQFRFGSTSPRTMEIAGELIRLGADPARIATQVYHNMPPAAMKLLGKVINGVEYHHDDRVCLLTLSQAMLAESGARESDAEGLVDFTLFSRGVCIGALLKELGPRQTKVSMRSRDDVNVAAVASEFGGGGHVNAAGCTLDMPLAEARTRILDILGELAEADRGK